MNPIMSMLRSTNNAASQQTKSKSSLPDCSNMSFPEFVRMMRGKDAKTIVEKLRANGEMSEQEFQTLKKQAESNAGSFTGLVK